MKPTNDLDVETLELLEELLMNYEGTLILVSHDRDFVDNVVTSTLVFEGNAKVNEYVGGYEDWLRQRESDSNNASKKVEKNKSQAVQKSRPVENKDNKKTVKLSYKEQRELDQLPALIESLDGELKELTEKMSSADFYRQQATDVAVVTDRLAKVEKELANAYKRWEQLESD